MSSEIASQDTPEVRIENGQKQVELPVLSAKQLHTLKINKGLALVAKLSGVTLPFPGIPMQTLTNLITAYDEYAIENGLKSPTEKVDEYSKHGIKIVAGDHPRAGNIFALPANMPVTSQNIVAYGTLVQRLDPSRVENPDLRELIELFSKK